LPVSAFIDSGEAETKTGPFGTQLKASDYVEHGTPVINVRNIGLGTIRTEKLEFLAPETVERLSSHLLRSGDIVFGRKGAVERHVLIRREQNGWFQGSDCLRLRISGSRLDSRFVSYSFLTDEHKQWMMNQCSHGATMASLNQEIIWRIQLRFPALKTQRKIAAILSAYDDLIENNTRRIAILEEMAQAIYREWFVHFRFPGHEQARFVDSPLGRIPEGWRVAVLSDVAEINALSVKKGKEPHEINYVDIASVSTGRIDEVRPLRFAEAPGRARRVLRHGDVIWSTVRPNRKSFCLVLDPPSNMIGSTGFAVVSCTKAPFSYVYLAITTEDFVGYLVNHATGSAYPAVNSSDFEKATILVPNGQILQKFHELVEPMVLKINRMLSKNRILREARDLLLPKLISGQLDVEALDIETGELALEAEA
jgi:type I restriction enzyme S subunit